MTTTTTNTNSNFNNNSGSNAQANVKASPKAKAKVKSSESGLTEARRQILLYLVSHRFGTTRQLNVQLQPGKVVQHTLGDLDRLRKLGMLRSFPYHSPQGGRPSLCWLLQRPGAYAVGQAWASHYDREPKAEIILYRDWQIELEQVSEWADWELIQPATVSPGRPLPTETPQYARLVETLRLQQGQAINHLWAAEQLKATSLIVLNYQQGFYRGKVPRKANDYVAYQQGQAQGQGQARGQTAKDRDGSSSQLPRAVVLILAHRDATEKFWQDRLQLYKSLLGKLPIAAVFASESQAYASRDYIRRGGMEVMLLDQLYPALLEVGQRELKYQQLLS